MSLSPAQENYVRKITLIDRTNSTRTAIVEGPILGVDNNLDEYFLKAELVNAGNILTDNGRITLRIDGDGTFIRDAPNLVDENAKTKYLIDMTIEQGVESSKIFRFEISQAIIQEDENFGEVLVITGRGREYILKENLSGRQLFFKTPNEAMEERILDHQGGTTGNALFGFTTNNLPNNESLRQDWLPTGPRPIHDLMQEIITRVALPGTSGGVLRDFYWDADADPTAINFFDFIAEEFGRLPLADGDRVTINPQEFGSAEQKDKTVITDSLVFKNQIILRGNSSKGSLPMEFVRHSSNFEHAKRRPEWSGSAVTYAVDDIVKRIITSPVGGSPTTSDFSRFFKAKSAHTSSGGVTPESTSGQTLWSEDFTIYPEFISNGTYKRGNIVTETGATVRFFQCNTDEAAPNAFSSTISSPQFNSNFTELTPAQGLSNYTPFVPFTPWTSDADLWLSNMTQNVEAGYRGGFVDWNFIRANYDRVDFSNEFGHISHKWVTRQSNAPPTGDELFNGQRILVGAAPTGAFDPNANDEHANKVAQFDRSITPIWRFSTAPTTNDILTNLSTLKIIRYNGTSWVDGWEVNANNDRTSPLHLVKEIRYIESPGGDGTPNQGLEFEFDWRLAIDGGDDNNRSSRGAWINFWHPFPRLALGGKTIGEAYGGSTHGTFDATNLDFNRKGQVGWHRGIDTEDFGRVSGLAFKMKFRAEESFGEKIDIGLANMPMIFFAVDLFDRVFFHEFTLRRNDGWENVTIPFGTKAPIKLYYNRINEVISIAGWNPFGDFFFAEREFTGVGFNWRFVKMWGIQWKHSYDDPGRYNNSFVEDLKANVASIGQSFAVGVQNLFIATEDPGLIFDIDRVKLAISDLRYVKELYVSSEDTTVSGARMDLINRESEVDYQTAKLAAQGQRERTKFFPQTLHIRSFGDVRLRIGHRFLVTGDKVPGGTQELVVQRIKHIIDSTSYKMEIEAKRKFVIP